jgi:pimeloyl-ACP methyl ester carboxylesterase
VINRGTGPELGDHLVHCWIQRSADPESLRSGSRQSYFEDCRDQRYTAQGDLAETDTDGAFIERFGSLNGLATGRTSLVVGGYRLGAGLGSGLACARPARYSSAGMTDTNWPGKPVDCSSMSERSRALPGTIAAGVRSGSLSLVQGTSSAAPFVARKLVETFVIIDEDCAQEAQGDNYLCLLNRYPPKVAAAAATDGNDPCPSSDDPALIKARLGTVRVPPHWQPGIEPHARDRAK